MSRSFSEAEALLSEGIRSENRDHAFGDREVYWTNSDGKEIGGGYFNGAEGSVWLETGECWSGADARRLANCGKVGTIGRNDSTGPDEYADGACMPALTLEGVRDELTR